MNEMTAGLRAAEAMRADGRIEDAERSYRTLIAVLPPTPRAFTGLGHCLRHRGDRAAALGWFREAEAADPDDVEAKLAIAEELNELGPLGEAEARFRAILGAAPGQPRALRGLAECYRRQGEHAAALACLHEAAAADPGDVETGLSLADMLRASGALAAAAAAYLAILGAAPDCLRALLGLGYCARARHDRAAALARFGEAQATHPGDVESALAIGEELIELGRLDEAEARFRALRDDPAGRRRALLGLGHCHRRRGDRPTALACFREVTATMPGDVEARLAIAEEMRDRGEPDEAAAVVEAVLAEHPDHCGARLTLGRTHREARRWPAALAAFERAAVCDPRRPEPLVEMAAEARRAGRPIDANALLDRAIGADPGDTRALVALGEALGVEKNFERALALFGRAQASPQPSVWGYVAAAHTLMETGRIAEAMATLDAAEARRGVSADVFAKRSELLSATGAWHEALRLLRAAEDAFPRHFWLWTERVRVERRVGDRARGRRLLLDPPAATAAQRGEVHYLRAVAAEEDWRLEEALAECRAALAQDPAHGGACSAMARLCLLTLDLPGATTCMRRYIEIEASSRIVQRLSLNISQTHTGQLLDEYALEAAVLAGMVEVSTGPAASRIEGFQAIARRNPDSTPAAITLLIAMRQQGRLALAPSTPLPGAIPARIVQFWDAPDVPPDVACLMASWREQQPDHAYVRFDDRTAQAFLAARYPRPVLAAYRQARGFAQKTDIFRLAVLYAEGGYWADADDRCLAPLARVVPRGCGLLLYQEDYGTIGNNFIGAAPQNPVIGRALSGAVLAILRGDSDIVWMSTGPGLLTRAFVQAMGRQSGPAPTPPAGAVVLDRGELFPMIAMHCRLAYKKTMRHWGEAAFNRRKGPPKPRPPTGSPVEAG